MATTEYSGLVATQVPWQTWNDKILLRSFDGQVAEIRESMALKVALNQAGQGCEFTYPKARLKAGGSTGPLDGKSGS